MAYKIGEVAALLGLTPEAIRHYERFGIIEPHKDGQSAYRYFDGWDLILLSACRQYRSLGFSLEDSLHLISDQSPEGVLSSLGEQEDLIREQIARLQGQLSTLEAWRRDAEKQYRLLGTFRIEESTETFMLPYQTGDELTEDPCIKAMMKEWFSYIPYVYVGHLLGEKTQTGICMSGEAVPFLHPSITAAVRFLPRQTGLHTAILFDRKKETLREAVLPLLRRADELHAAVDGPVFCRCNFLFAQGRKISDILLDCFLPVRLPGGTVDSQTV